MWIRHTNVHRLTQIMQTSRAKVDLTSDGQMKPNAARLFARTDFQSYKYRAKATDPACMYSNNFL
jgi:hypothetical protein